MDLLCKYQILSLNFIKRYRSIINWNNIIVYQKHISINDLYTYKSFINFKELSSMRIDTKKEEISLEFLLKFNKDLYWNSISQYYILTEVYIDKLKLYLNWDLVIKYQSMSLEFIQKNINYIKDINAIYLYQKIPLDYTFKY